MVIRNFLVTLKLFLNAKSSLSLWSKLAHGHGKWFLNTNLFLIKIFLITKFDCTAKVKNSKLLYISTPFNHCDAEMRIFICIKSVKLRYICPANQQFFCDDENPFFYGSIKKSYLVPHGRMKLMICPQDYDDYHHKSTMESKAI